jgi:hypothetical protein
MGATMGREQSSLYPPFCFNREVEEMRARKTELLQVRMTPVLKDRIEQRAKAMGLNTSDYVRASLAANALETLAMREGRRGGQQHDSDHS